MLREAERALYRLNKLLEATSRMSEIYRAYLKRIAHSFKVRRVSLMLLDETRRELLIHEAEGLAPELKNKTRVKLGEGIAGWVAQKGESLLVRDIDESRHRKEKKKKGFRSRAFICIPIKIRGKVYGVLNVSEKKNLKAFSLEELKRLEIFGMQLAVLVENERLRTQIEWLEKNSVEEMSEISHDCRIPLFCVQEVLHLMEGGELGPITDSQKEFLELAKRNIKRMTTALDEFLTAATKVGRRAPRVEKVDLVQLMEELGRDFELVARRKRVHLELEIPPKCDPVVTDRSKVYEVMMNLVDNAVKHTRKGTDVTLRLKPVPEFMRLEVEDRGPGIDEGQKPLIFDKVASMKYTQAQGLKNSHGLGLAISRDIIERLGGRIGFHSQKGQGATFFVELPKNNGRPSKQLAVVS